MRPFRSLPSAAPSASRKSSRKKAQKAHKRIALAVKCIWIPDFFFMRFCAFLWLKYFLPQGSEGRCIDYRATQKGRGRSELVTSELTALGLKNKGQGNEQHGTTWRKIKLPRDNAFGGGPDRILALHEGVDGNPPVDAGRKPFGRTMVRQRHTR